MQNDVPPKDEQILAALAGAEGGLTPRELFDLLSKMHSPDNVVKAIQRAFDRGIVELSSGARLVAVKVQEAA